MALTTPWPWWRGSLALAAMALLGAAPPNEPPRVEQNAIYPDAATLLQPFPNASWGQFPRTGHDVVRLADGLYTFRYGGQATRNIFMVTPVGVIVTDPISVTAARILRQEIRKITPLPVRYVIYSHAHWDHIRGGQIFKDEGARFIAHQDSLSEIKRRPHPEVVMPDEGFRESRVVRLGGRSLELTYLGRGHGSGNIVMRPDAGRFVFVVDTVIPGRMPLAFMADTDPQGSIDSLRKLEALDIRAIIPGHGPPIADRSALTERRMYLEALLAATRNALDQPSPPINIAASIRVPAFAYLRGYDQDISRNAERAVIFYYIGW